MSGLESFATGGSQAIRIPRPRSPESRPSSHPKATIDRCIAVTHAVDQKADINCNASIGIGGSLAAPPLPHHRTYGSVYGGSLD